MRFFKNVTTIIILVTFCSLKGFANQCSSLYTATSNITRGYLQHVNNMKLTGEHTIKNPVAYLKDNLGEVFLNSLIKKDFGFITIALGNGPEALETAKKNGLQLEELIEKKVGFHKIRKVTNSKGEQGYLIYRVNGYDREIHIQSFFKMLNVPDNKIITIGKNKNWEKDLTNFFTELGPPPSLVVYGFSETAVLGLILKHPISNLKFIPKAYRVLKPKKTPLTDQQSDLEGRPIQIITLNNGQTLWLFKAMYGSLSADLMRALGRYGVKNFLTIGTAGSLTRKLPVGTIFTPEKFDNGNNQFEPIKVISPIAGVPVVGNYEKVDSPNIETKDWLSESTAKGLETVEVELGHLILWAKQNPEIKLSSALVISDILVGENHRDMTEWGSADLTPLRDKLVNIISNVLKIESVKDLKFKEYRVFNFTTERSL